MRTLILMLSVVWLALPVLAEIAGQNDPELQAAVGDWLAGNEADALPVLAAQAASGNVAARLLLGQIDAFPALQGDWLSGLPRAERIALLRAPGGLSGKRWSTGLDDPVAQSWGRLWDTAATPEVILDFARLEEPRAARFAALTLARRQRQGFAAVAADPAFPSSLQAYALRETKAGAEALHPALGGYWGLMPLGSPVEALISSDIFNRSTRGIAATLRHMRGPVESACLTDALK